MNYDWDQQIPVFGFGGKPKFQSTGFVQNVASHCFPCTGLVDNANCYQLKGIMDCYNFALSNVELAGPTLFAPIISEAMKLANSQKLQETGVYTCLVILTDGEIHDMQQTVDLLCQAGGLPLSIIIIGVGNDEFKNMEILDGDHGLYNSKGQKAPRDIVQFVPFRNFKGDRAALAQAVLAELPDQLVQWNQLMGRKPRPATQVNIQKLGYDQNLSENQYLGSQGMQNFLGGFLQQ